MLKWFLWCGSGLPAGTWTSCWFGLWSPNLPAGGWMFQLKSWAAAAAAAAAPQNRQKKVLTHSFMLIDSVFETDSCAAADLVELQFGSAHRLIDPMVLQLPQSPAPACWDSPEIHSNTQNFIKFYFLKSPNLSAGFCGKWFKMRQQTFRTLTITNSATSYLLSHA